MGVLMCFTLILSAEVGPLFRWPQEVPEAAQRGGAVLPPDRSPVATAVGAPVVSSRLPVLLSLPQRPLQA